MGYRKALKEAVQAVVLVLLIFLGIGILLAPALIFGFFADEHRWGQIGVFISLMWLIFGGIFLICLFERWAERGH